MSLDWKGGQQEVGNECPYLKALEAFKVLKQACMNSPVLAFANYIKDFLLKTDTSTEGLGEVLSKKQEDGWVSPSSLWQSGAHHMRELPLH